MVAAPRPFPTRALIKYLCRKWGMSGNFWDSETAMSSCSELIR